ncbi:MAG: hypothetical protein IJ343_15130, partial [Clostridia bacterium]|nr:hypothetical protein [Clostridia bacterium]
MPKKLLALLLILATFLSSAGFLGFLGLGSKKLTDPVLVPATDVTLPADSVSDLGGGYVLAIDRRTPAVSVIDLRSGRTTPLTTRKQDHDRWIAIINEKVQRGLLGKNAALLLAELERSPDSPPVITPDFRLTSSHCRYALCSTGLTNALVDRQTATLLPLEQDYDIIGVTAWEQLLYHRNDPDGYTLRLCSIDGRELCSAKLPLEEYPFRTVYPMEDGLLLLLNSRLDAETITARTAVMVLDRQLNAGPIIDLS